MLTDVDEAALAETAGALAVPTLTRTMDVSDRWAHLELAAEVREWLPAPLAVVVNNAGVAMSQTVEAASTEDVEWMMNINFWGVVHGTQAFLPILREQDAGAVVNISSVFGMIAWPTQSAYNASKFAVRGYTEALRHELHGTGVQVTCVHPGGIDTNIVRNSRHYVDDLGRTDVDVLQAEFQRIARTTPAKAAATILERVERGEHRVLIGADARATDLLQRIAPVRYFDVIRRLAPVLRR